MEIHPLTILAIREMQNVLSESAGYTVSLDDEVAYFDPDTAKSWFLARGNDGQVVGFIRNFAQNSEWSLAEFYIKPNIHNRLQIAQSLLTNFKRTVSFPAKHRLRIDISSRDGELNEILKSEGFSEKCQTFLFLERNVDLGIPQFKPEPISNTDAASVAETLSHLHPVLENEAQKWIESKTIRVIRHEGQIVAAAQIYESDDAIEVNRIATHGKFLRRGFAKKIMEQILAEASRLQKRRVYLKVEDVRRPALSFYKGMGFIENQSRRQVWHSRWF